MGRCNYCGFVTDDDVQLTNHLTLHSAIVFTCNECGKSFNQRNMYNRHMKIHDATNYYCPVCSKTFTTARYVKSHIYNVHNDTVRLYECSHEECERYFKSKQKAQTHYNFVHSSLRPFKCTKCTSSYKSAKHLQDHNQSVHDNVTYQCTLDGCTKVYRNKSNLREHLSWHNNKSSTTCHMCGKIYARKSGLYRHIRNVHQDLTKLSIKPTIKLPSKPTIKLLSKPTIKPTIKLQSKPTILPFNPEIKLPSKPKIEKTSKPKAYKCCYTGCDKKYTRQYSLKRHIDTVHKRLRPFACTYDSCDMTFGLKQTLDSHIRFKHTKQRNYRCSTCSQMFITSGNLNAHIHAKHTCDTGITYKSSANQINSQSSENSKIKQIWSALLNKHAPSSSIDYHYQPDHLYIGTTIVELDECDEHQHIGYTYSYDEQQLLNIYDHPDISGKTMIVVRWNPDKCRCLKHDIPIEQRLQLLIDLKLHIRNNLPPNKIHVFYMFYDADNPVIVKNISHTMIYSKSDFPLFGKSGTYSKLLVSNTKCSSVIKLKRSLCN